MCEKRGARETQVQRDLRHTHKCEKRGAHETNVQPISAIEQRGAHETQVQSAISVLAGRCEPRSLGLASLRRYQ